MSWGGYVNRLLESGQCDKAAIFSRSGDTVWATSPKFHPSPTEINGIAFSFERHGPNSPLFAAGFAIAGQEYDCATHDEDLIIGKNGNEGIVIAKTKNSMIIGHYAEGVETSDAQKSVETLAEEIRGYGY